MALTISNTGTVGNTTSSATLAITGITAAVGDWLVVHVAADNNGTAGAASLSTTMTDSAGNTFVNRSITNRTAGAVADGVTLGLWTAEVTSAISNGSITVNFSPSTPAKAAVVKRVAPGAGEVVEFVEVGPGASGSGTAYSITATAVQSGHTIFGATGLEQTTAAAADTDTTNGSWSSAYTAAGSTGTNGTSISITSQHKTVTATGNQVYNTSSGSTRDWAINWLTLTATAAPSEPIEAEANQTIPTFTQTATLRTPASVAGTQAIQAFAQTATLEAVVVFGPQLDVQGSPAIGAAPFGSTAIGGGIVTAAPAFVTVTANQALPAFTQTATGTVRVAATATQTLPVIGQTAAARVAVAATASQTLPALGQTATAAVRVAATAVQTLPAFQQTAQLSLVQSGIVANQLLPAISQNATVAVRVAAAASQTLPAFTQTAAASTPAAVSGSQQLPALTQSASARTVTSAIAAQQLPAFTQAATARTVVGAAATQTLPVIGQQATAGPVVRVTAAQQLPAFTQVATAELCVAAVANQQLPAFEQMAAAAVVIHAQANQAIPAFAQTATAKRIRFVTAAGPAKYRAEIPVDTYQVLVSPAVYITYVDPGLHIVHVPAEHP
jgi:hypothetical protein